MEKFKMALLAIACLYLAGLNLWLEFKSWFDKRYERKRAKKGAQHYEDGLDERGIPSIVGRSKFNLQEEQLKQEQRRKEADEKEKQRKRAEKQLSESNNPIKYVAYDKFDIQSFFNDQPISWEEDIELDLGYSPQDVVLASRQSTTFHEMELLAKSLQGQVISKTQEKEAAIILSKLNGTCIYDQFLNQIRGAEDRASAILRGLADETAMNYQ